MNLLFAAVVETKVAVRYYKNLLESLAGNRTVVHSCRRVSSRDSDSDAIDETAALMCVSLVAEVAYVCRALRSRRWIVLCRKAAAVVVPLAVSDPHWSARDIDKFIRLSLLLLTFE